MDDREYGIQLQEKFEFYLLGLIFTILALAVQTAKFDNINIIAACLELSSWVALLTSGLVGLWRMEWIPVARFDHADQCDSEADLQRFRELAQRGISAIPVRNQEEPARIETLILKREQHIERTKTKLLKHGASVRIKYRVHRWFFVSGMCLLIVARGVVPATKIYAAIVR